MTVTSLQVETIKVGKGKKAKKETVLVLQFSGALNAGAAGNANAYQLAQIIKVKATGKGKHRQPPRTKLGRPVAPASAVYNASNDSVTLTPRGKLNLAKPEELIINAALVTDTLGRPIDGNDDGQPGGNYVATFGRTRCDGRRGGLGANPGAGGHHPGRDRRPARPRRAGRLATFSRRPARSPVRSRQARAGP